MKLALVTGGNRRLGAAIAATLARDGWTLALHSHQPSEPEPALREVLHEWHGFVADLGDPAQVEGLVGTVAGHFGAVPPLLVNNASLFSDDDAGSATAASLATHLAVNTVAPLTLALSLARAGGTGSIVNILDQRIRNPVPDQLSYTVSKSALAAATRALAVALAPFWRVNAVAPGLTLPTPDYAEGQMERIGALMPLGQLATPAEVAAAVLYFAGAGSVTGGTLFVDGGAQLTAFERDFAFL